MTDAELFEYAAKLGRPKAAAIEPVLLGFADDEAVSPKDLYRIILYSDVQSIVAVLNGCEPSERKELFADVSAWIAGSMS